MKFDNNREFGNWGEKKAVEYFKKKGYKIVERNYQKRQGEIDLILSKDEFLVFVEVKTRSNSEFGPPQAAVDYHKQKKIRKIASFFLANNNYKGYKMRFDVITIFYKSKKCLLDHYKNCF